MGIVVEYTLKDAKTGRLSFRRAFPAELRAVIPGNPREHKVSLRGQNIADADVSARYRAALAEYEAIVRRARKVVDCAFDELDAPTIAFLAEAFRAELLANDDEARWDSSERQLYRDVAADLDRAGIAYKAPWRGREGKRWAEKTRATLESQLPIYRQMRAEGDLDAILAAWTEEALDFLEARGLAVSPDAVGPFRQLCRALNDAALAAGEDMLKRLDGIEVPTPSEPVAPTSTAPEAPTATLRPAVPIMATFEAYAVHMTPGVRSDWRRNMEHLVAFVGHDDASRLTTDDVMAWRDALATEPGKKGKPRDPVTIRGKFVGALKSMLKWAVQERKLDKNVAAPVVVKVPKKAKLRQPDFTKDEAHAILTASLIPAGPRYAPEHALARRWIPWLCAYSGGRVNEFSQLRAEDVQQIEGIWAVRITPEAGNVKTMEARIVPLHPHLVEQGFPAIAQAKAAGPLFYDPRRQRAKGEGNRHVKKVGERLAEWVRQDVGISDPAIKPNHAWRHLFKSRAFAAGVQERVADAIQGHAPATVGRGYGSIDLATLAEAISSLPRFEVEGS